MRIECLSDHAVDTVAAATGRSFTQWFGEIDSWGGVALGRREINQRLLDAHKVDPWWITTINVEYEIARGLKEKDGRAKGYTICATKSIKAAPAACYDSFASTTALNRWFGPGHALSFTDGGSLHNGDGNRALIRKLSPGKAIKLIWQQADAAPDTPVEIKFAPAGAKTTVMVTHERLQNRADADGLRRAWGEALEKLKQVIETA
ncbi:MAG: SRPBCC domain-containing protein [Rhodanobacteraceae bacterium]|nr:SRPBCC domain-containing protein [Rhodanobacteraceae bacterium]